MNAPIATTEPTCPVCDGPTSTAGYTCSGRCAREYSRRAFVTAATTANMLEERYVPVADLPTYVGWTLNGILCADGTRAWGELHAAELDGDGMLITHPHHTKVRGAWVRVPVVSLVHLADPTGPCMVTVSRLYADVTA